MRLKKSYEIDMCNGPLLSRILLFSFPLVCSGVLQLLFNAADIIIAQQPPLSACWSIFLLVSLLEPMY